MRIVKVIILVLLVSLSACKNDKYPELSDGIYADIETNVGDILVQLEYKDVPMTVGNFVSLADGTNPRVVDSLKGIHYYDGLKFHRVISKSNGDNGDFMIQGGCPFGNGSGDPGYKFSDEYPQDSIGDLLFKHDAPGKLSMANSGPATNGSQFFITLVPTPHLDGKHTIFGSVIEGQGVVDSLVKTNTDILKINIIRVGSEAKAFDAPAAINEEFRRGDEIKAAFLEQVDGYMSQAEELPSGLKMYYINKGEGPRPGVGGDIRLHYSAFFANGVLLDTSRKDIAETYGIYNPARDIKDGYAPFPSKYSMDTNLIQGLKEGLLKMQIGDRVMFYIPAHLGYGEQGNRGVPPNTDLYFDLEVFSATE